MTREQLQAVRDFCEKNRAGLYAKAEVGQPPPPWAMRQISLYTDYENLAIMNYNKEQENIQLREQLKRTLSLLELMENALMQLVSYGKRFIDFRKKVQPTPIKSHLFFHLSQLYPPDSQEYKQLLLDFTNVIDKNDNDTGKGKAA